jgi:Carbohydrate family 9 binding domain-like
MRAYGNRAPLNHIPHGPRSLTRCMFSYLLTAALAWPQASHVLESKQATEDVDPDTNPDSSFWSGASRIIADRDPFGKSVPGHRTQLRSRWTKKNLYFLFVCNYEQLNLKPDPSTDRETYELWNWDVAEVFIGSDLENIRRYKEFEVSPQGEWIDLDIDLISPHAAHDWAWNSGFKVAARIDRSSQVWYACMRIPYASIDTHPANVGNVLRANFYRSQGPPGQRREIAWQPTHQSSFHVPESFGTLKLSGPGQIQ